MDEWRFNFEWNYNWEIRNERQRKLIYLERMSFWFIIFQFFFFFRFQIISRIEKISLFIGEQTEAAAEEEEEVVAVETERTDQRWEKKRKKTIESTHDAMFVGRNDSIDCFGISFKLWFNFNRVCGRYIWRERESRPHHNSRCGVHSLF